MKIIQVSTYFHPSVGGVERQAEEIAAHLQELGHQVDVYTTNATHGREKRMQRLADSYRNLRIHRFRYWIALGNFFKFAPGLVRAMLWADYDIVHVHNMHDGHLIPIILISKFRRKKVVVTGHNPFVVDAQKRGGKLNALVNFYDKLLVLFAPGIDKYNALLESEAEVVNHKFKFPRSKITIVPNGIQDIFYAEIGNYERFFKEWEIDPTKWKLIVGAACRLNYVKGLQNLLTAVRENPEVLFIFAGGDDGYYPQLRKMYNQYQNVLFTESYLASNELLDFYAAIDLFLLPSIYEPFGMTLVEALAQGKTVLATANGGPKEILHPQIGDILAPEDQQGWSEKITALSAQKEQLIGKAELARQAANQYQWSNIIKRLVTEVYEPLLRASA